MLIKRGPDWWLTAWDEYGESVDTNRTVQVIAGILAPETDPAIAISVAGETPVTLTPDAVGRFKECLDWAVEEYKAMLLRAGERSDSADADTAVLDHAQWQPVVVALQESAESHPEVLDALTASAPHAWLPNTGEAEPEGPTRLRDVQPGERDGTSNGSNPSE